MAVQVQLVRIDNEPDRYHLEFSNGSGIDFENFAAAKVWAMDFETQDLAMALLFAWFIARQPDGSNTSLVVGKTLVLDLEAAQMLRVQ